MEIPRDMYLNRLIRKKHNGLIKIITGIRRCGKSYLLNTLFYRHLIASGIEESHIIRFAFDMAADLELIGENPLDMEINRQKTDPKKFLAYIREKTAEPGKYYLLLDEIQYLGAFETVLNSYLRDDKFDVYVTGSNSKFLSSDIITEFAGRGDEIRVYPLSFSEYCTVCKNVSPAEAFDDYMTYGGLPHAALLPDAEDKTAYLTAQISHVYLQDVIERHNLKDDRNIAELVSVVASETATLTNPRRLSQTFESVKNKKLTAITIDRYIEFLEQAFLIHRSFRYDVRGKKYISTPYKLYFEDTGLRNACIAFRQLEPPYLMETIIYNELRIRGFSVDTGVVSVQEKNSQGNPVAKQLEIDFVANRGNQRYYIQSAWMIPDTEKQHQELRPFDLTRDSFKKILITGMQLKPRLTENGYVVMGILDFLLNADSLTWNG